MVLYRDSSVRILVKSGVVVSEALVHQPPRFLLVFLIPLLALRAEYVREDFHAEI